MRQPGGVQAVTGCSSAWLEHCVRDAGVAGSNPVTPTITDSNHIWRGQAGTCVISARRIRVRLGSVWRSGRAGVGI
jgi:hypothetical protein